FPAAWRRCFFGESGMPGFPRIFPLVGISKADLRISDQNQPIGVPVEMSLGEFLLVLWNVFVPDLRRFIDGAITIEHRKILFSAFSFVWHPHLPWFDFPLNTLAPLATSTQTGS